MPDNSLEEISDDDIVQIFKLFISYALEEDEEMGMEGLSDRGYEKFQEAFNIIEVGERHDIARGET